jgi:hypothetical protein
MSQKCHNENNDNNRKDNIPDTVENCKSQYNILAYHGPESVLKNQYFGKVHLRRLDISEYIPGFSDSLDGITEKYI